VVAAFALDRSFLSVPPHVHRATAVELYLCPAGGSGATADDAAQPGFTEYLGVSGTDQFTPSGVLYPDSAVRLTDISDGTSSTLLIGERPRSRDGHLGWWYAGWGNRKTDRPR
jgi:hypothetical protein